MGSKTNSQQAPEHWLREITKAKVRQAKPFFYSKKGKNREKEKFGQFWASLASLSKF